MNTATKCDHCGAKGDLYTHLVPLTITIDPHGKSIHEQAKSLLLCGGCGAQRQQDLRRFFRGAPPSRLVCVEPPAKPIETWGPPV